ncbi:MAG: 2,4-dihydroxyhept-2-ene-1,7-dioic acid aldolase [Planctomycetaceae bacterium]|nr:MAG: 2,4-dihydroxyhept-2-ene-1,7-dioic acid aldolase [Planctomycetaceae bacterium]
MEPARRLRERLQQRTLTLGALVTDHVWPGVVELARRAGMDYLIVDMEHGPVSSECVADTCAAGRHQQFPVLIRPRANDYMSLRYAMDLGPCGFLLANVESAAELDLVQQAVYLPPRGRRRPGGVGNRWVSDLALASWQQQVEADFLVLPQIETRRGLERRTEIAAHPLTTALAVGPFDLSAELGCCGDFTAPVLQQALEQIRSTAEQVGKPAWMYGPLSSQLARQGWYFLCLGEISGLLEQALRERCHELHGEIRSTPISY